MVDLGYWIGWLGVACGMMVPLPQLWKIWRTGRVKDVSLGTYSFLVVALICYLLHAIYLRAEVFIVAQSINLTTNMAIFILLLRARK